MTRRVELYEGSAEDKRIVAESNKVYNTSVKSGVTVGKAVMELHPATAISRIKSGKDLDGNDIPIAERVLEVASVIPVAKAVDKGLDAAKGIEGWRCGKGNSKASKNSPGNVCKNCRESTCK